MTSTAASETILFVNEYGAVLIPECIVSTRLAGLFNQWARLLHENYLAQIEECSYLAGSGVWAQSDFGSEARGETQPHVNAKGLIPSTGDAETFPLPLSGKLFAHACVAYRCSRLAISHGNGHRRFVRMRANYCSNNRVYTNLATVELFPNQRSWKKAVGQTEGGGIIASKRRYYS
jgi:hypothetical protein